MFDVCVVTLPQQDGMAASTRRVAGGYTRPLCCNVKWSSALRSVCMCAGAVPNGQVQDLRRHRRRLRPWRGVCRRAAEVRELYMQSTDRQGVNATPVEIMQSPTMSGHEFAHVKAPAYQPLTLIQFTVVETAGCKTAHRCMQASITGGRADMATYSGCVRVGSQSRRALEQLDRSQRTITAGATACHSCDSLAAVIPSALPA